MAKLIACRDYSSKKDKGKKIVGYKIHLTKAGIEKTGIDYKKDDLNIDYKEGKIIITRQK